MVIVGLFLWWYGRGWLQCVRRVRDHLLTIYDYFSLDLLIRTLFAPFRQISAGRVRGSLTVQLRAFFDRLISRTIGAIVRMIVIMIGSVTLCVAAGIGVIMIVGWPLVPLLPVACVLMAMIGWVPWKI